MIDDPDDFYDDYEDGVCYECGGERFISDCVEEWACVDPEYGCDYCTRRCPVCNPAKPNLAQAVEAGTAETERLGPKGESAVPNGDAPHG